MSTPGEVEDEKPVVLPGYVTLKVNGQDGSEVFFRVKRDAKLKKLICAYRERKSVDESIVYLYLGDPIGENDTPDKLQMEDVDERCYGKRGWRCFSLNFEY